MPYMTQMDGDKHCVYKKGDDDAPTGESLGCHASAEDAQAQIAVLYAEDQKMPMMEMVIFEHVSRFKKEYPDVPLSSELDPADFDENTRFVTLPLMPIGAKSRNGRTYSEQAVRGIVDQINQKRPEGGWGHLAVEERATRYDPPALRWVGAMVDTDGLAWGKAIPVTESAREHIRIAKQTRARIGTSIYGKATLKGNEVMSIELEKIDLVDSERVGIPEAAAVPIVEMSEEIKEQNPVSEQLIQELTTERDGLKTQISELTAALDTHKGIVAELCQVMGIEKADDLKTVVSELVNQRNDATNKARLAIVGKLVGELKLPQTAKLVAAAIGTPDTDDEEKIKTQIAELMASDLIQPVAEMERVKIGGPRAIVGNAPFKPSTITPEQMESGVKRYGIN